MANVKISELPDGTTPLAGTEATPIVQSNITVQVPASALGVQPPYSLSSQVTGTLPITNGGTGQTTDGVVLINSQSGTTYTLVLSDAGKCVEMNNGSSNTLTVPPNSSVAFTTGTSILVRQMGAGQTSIAAGVGVTINTPSTLDLNGQYSLISLHKRATNEWCIDGSLA